MARAKKKEDKNTLYYAALYSKHSELYEMAYEDSKKVVNSVLDSIKQLLKECEVLSLPDFGKFENHERKSYQAPMARSVLCRPSTRYDSPLSRS